MMIALKIVLLFVLAAASLIALVQAALWFFTHDYSPAYPAARAAARRWGYGVACGWLAWIAFVVGW